MKPAIEVRNISKSYQIGKKKNTFSLRDNIIDFLSNPLDVVKSSGSKNFWTLRDVSFQVLPGEIFGIVGYNGAGKSTLLKILSRITPPTSGEAILRGRVASLLEVGTGFHPELTGRENIFLNGAIIGMRRNEILRRFDEIVNFAGVEEFLDTPVKHYSSGMYTKLAFSVASFLESDILLVDEVLAVGDAEFQKRSLGKIENMTQKEGKAVILVSHNMVAVESICERGIFLNKGRVSYNGKIKDVIERYLSDVKRLTL